MNNEIRFTPFENGLGIEADGQRFVLRFERATADWNAAGIWARSFGGHLPTVMQAIVLTDYQDEICAKLRELGKFEYGGWWWTNKSYNTSIAYLACQKDFVIVRYNASTPFASLAVCEFPNE